MNVVAALAVFAIVFAVCRVLARRRAAAAIERRVRAHVRVEAPVVVKPEADAGRLRSALDALEQALEGRRRWTVFVARVERAGVERPAVDVFAAIAALTVLGALFGLATAAAFGFVVALVGVPVATWLALGVRVQRRLRAFDEQLPDLLASLGASLRAGHGFLHSLQAVAQDAPEPAGHELRRALSEIRVGRPVEEALAGIADRVASADFEYVLTAIAVQRQVGGSLAGLFDTVTATVRERHQFARKVKALTATGRTSAYALVALPFAIAALLSLLNHHYLDPLFRSHVGRLFIVLGCCSLSVGIVLVRRVVNFKV